MASRLRSGSGPDVPITYVGQQAGFHIYRAGLQAKSGHASYIFTERVVEFLTDHTYGDFHVGTGFADSTRYPAVTVDNPTDKDLFILLNNEADMELFENRFLVVGFTPRLML